LEEKEIIEHPGFSLYASILTKKYSARISKTPRFSDNFSQYILNFLGNPALSEQNKIQSFLHILEMYEIVNEDVKQMRKHLTVDEITKKAYEFIDERIKEELTSQDEIKPTCKKGCSACCHLNVSIGSNEAKLLSKNLTQEQIKHLKKQRDVLNELGNKDYESFPHVTDWETSRCVFLINNECSVYDDRPTACRMYYVASDPKLCHPVEYKNGKTAQLITVKAEALRAVMTHYYHNKPMPIYLLQTIGE
jgi:Fe-S-cluster containining protein